MHPASHVNDLRSQTPEVRLRTVEQSEQRRADATAIVSNAMDHRPPDVVEAHWRTALIGLRKFIADGGLDQARRCGWTDDELLSVPPVWSRGDLCGAGLLIGDAEVVSITPTEIRIKVPVSGSVQAFRRAPTIDYALVFRSRLQQIAGNYSAGSEEARLRAIEHTVAEYRRNTGADLAAATVAVQAVLRATKQ
jgi:hypothetical protein